METDNSESYILFEGENDIRYDRFGYDGSDERISDINSPYIQPHNNLNEKGQMKKLALGNNIGFNQDTLVIKKSIHIYCFIKKYKNRNDGLKLTTSLHQLQSDLNLIRQHNAKYNSNDEDDERRNKIPMLWIYNYKTIYSAQNC
ncbi:conserved Plasmodium protein, unknown function [Plasmodium vinckei vinckei]|uniref:Uncharacterized protein n=1 Tax=Plasmodium vinckei vinckei TaxID=54757 RepID=A0A449BSX3_PLAVN|nr:conserved Plasmodium protein, unknown function [Plasmodium vinckei vinckei]VEV56493.1 conserved Plasmodium protein, unknown function [Plasmodium vinckei vinckei]